MVLSGNDALPVKLCEIDLVKFDNGWRLIDEVVVPKESREEDVRSRAEETIPPIRFPHPSLCVDVEGAVGVERAAAMLSEAFDSD